MADDETIPVEEEEAYQDLRQWLSRFREIRGPHRRLLAALDQVEGSLHGPCGPQDIVALIRHVVRHHELAEGAPPSIVLPHLSEFPTDEDLRLARLDVVTSPRGSRVTGCSRWSPSWVRGDLSAVDLAISAPHGAHTPEGHVPSLAREMTHPPLDPFLARGFRFEGYQGIGQREAVRAAVRCPDGSALYVVLPTGTGKSLVGLIRGIIEPQRTTVVIVPTVALALDQELQLRHDARLLPGLPSQLAYHSELGEQERARMRADLRTGRQRLLFASPEAVTGSLAPSLFALAEQGLLSTFVVDEAHMISAWGEDFRAHFQMLPGLRQALVKSANRAGQRAPVTILMTATLTAGTYDLLNRLFSIDQPEIVSVSALRPEPRYLLGEDSSVSERDERLVDALRHLPRPAIVYVTEREECTRLVDLLRDRGFLRVRAFNGNTPDNERKTILRDWGSERPAVDVVVGTSAFGLGVNLSDVRSVVHACIPESLDRYYQEVGRGGRDHHTSVALLLPSRHRDERLARGLAGARFIGPEKGFARWEELRTHGEFVDNALHVPVDHVPTYLSDRRKSDSNESWNRLTVNLMASAGAIRLESAPPPALPTEGDAANWAEEVRESMERWARTQRVHLNRGDIVDEATWDNATAGAREASRRRAMSSLDRMLSLVSASACWRDAFRAEYTVSIISGGHQAVLAPSNACTGCPVHVPTSRAYPEGVRQDVDRRSAFTGFPLPAPAVAASSSDADWLILTASGHPKDFSRAVREVCEWAVGAQDIRRLVVPRGVLGDSDDDFFRAIGVGRWFFLDRELGVPPFPLPTLLVVPPDIAFPPAVLDPGQPFRVVLCDAEALAPTSRPGVSNKLHAWYPTMPWQEVM